MSEKTDDEQVGPVPERMEQQDEQILRDCSTCGGEREHEVSLAVLNGRTRENIATTNEKYARHPHKVYQCLYCGSVISEQI